MRPFTATLPCAARSSPRIKLSRQVLPEPTWPIRAVSSPERNSRFMFFKHNSLPYLENALHISTPTKKLLMWWVTKEKAKRRFLANCVLFFLRRHINSIISQNYVCKSSVNLQQQNLT